MGRGKLCRLESLLDRCIMEARCDAETGVQPATGLSSLRSSFAGGAYDGVARSENHAVVCSDGNAAPSGESPAA